MIFIRERVPGHTEMQVQYPPLSRNQIHISHYHLTNQAGSFLLIPKEKKKKKAFFFFFPLQPLSIPENKINHNSHTALGTLRQERVILHCKPRKVHASYQVTV